MKFLYEHRDLTDDYLFGGKNKPTKEQQLMALEDEGWEIFSINKYHASPDWQVVIRRPREGGK